MRYFWFIITVFIAFHSCQKAELGDCFMSTGDMVTETRYLEDFTCVNLYDKFNFYMVDDTVSKVRIEAGENLIAGITTEVADDTLHIRNTNTCNWVRSYEKPLNIYLSSDTFRRLFVKGFSHVETMDTFRANYFYMVAESPISEARIDVDVNTLYFSTSYSTGDFYLSGTTDSLRIFNFGYAYVYASDINSRRCWVLNQSTGDIHVRTEQRLHVEIYRTGNVYYYGNPHEINIIDIASTGDLIKVNSK